MHGKKYGGAGKNKLVVQTVLFVVEPEEPLPISQLQANIGVVQMPQELTKH